MDKRRINNAGQPSKTRKIGVKEFSKRLVRAAWDACRCHHAIFDPFDPLPAIGVYTNKFIAPIREKRRQGKVSRPHIGAPIK